MIDGRLDTVDEVHWSHYLVFTPSDISDTISDATSAHNNPAQGLNLTEKAKDRKGQSTILPFRRDTDAESQDE